MRHLQMQWSKGSPVLPVSGNLEKDKGFTPTSKDYNCTTLGISGAMGILHV